MRLPRRALLAAPLATPAFAQAPWQPDRPIRVVVPLAPGGATDVWARLCLDPVSEILRVPIVIENRSVTTDQAEERVERQAREFELLKPYLVERWAVAEGTR